MAQCQTKKHVDRPQGNTAVHVHALHTNTHAPYTSAHHVVSDMIEAVRGTLSRFLRVRSWGASVCFGQWGWVCRARRCACHAVLAVPTRPQHRRSSLRARDVLHRLPQPLPTNQHFWPVSVGICYALNFRYTTCVWQWLDSLYHLCVAVVGFVHWPSNPRMQLYINRRAPARQSQRHFAGARWIQWHRHNCHTGVCRARRACVYYSWDGRKVCGVRRAWRGAGHELQHRSVGRASDAGNR